MRTWNIQGMLTLKNIFDLYARCASSVFRHTLRTGVSLSEYTDLSWHWSLSVNVALNNLNKEGAEEMWVVLMSHSLFH